MVIVEPELMALLMQVEGGIVHNVGTTPPARVGHSDVPLPRRLVRPKRQPWPRRVLDGAGDPCRLICVRHSESLRHLTSVDVK